MLGIPGKRRSFVLCKSHLSRGEPLAGIGRELQEARKLSAEELNIIFIPNYFATPDEMSRFLNENDHQQYFTLKACLINIV